MVSSFSCKFSWIEKSKLMMEWKSKRYWWSHSKKKNMDLLKNFIGVNINFVLYGQWVFMIAILPWQLGTASLGSFFIRPLKSYHGWIKEIKLKNYQYLMGVAIRETLGSSLMGFFHLWNRWVWGVDGIIYNHVVSAAWTRMGFSSISILYFGSAASRCLSISVPMTWPRGLMKPMVSNMSAKHRQILEQTQAVLPIPRFTSWLYQPIFIYLGGPRLQSSGWNCGHLILTVCNQALEIMKPTMAATLLIANAGCVVGKSRRLSTYDGVTL